MRYGSIAVQGAMRDFTYIRTLNGCFDPSLVNWERDVLGSEDCLYLNVWTPTLDPAAKLAVMVWLHPGGYVGWSGYSPWTEGAALANEHKVIVVSINHRINVFGHLDLGEIGGKPYRDSANIGLLDIVDALTWVHENITAFGGDRDSVTIFGESGGGGKVCFLMAMPSARGLFHRAITQSAPIIRATSPDESAKTTQQILARLGIGRSNIRDLEDVSAAKLFDARGSEYIGPVATGDALPRHPFDPDAPEISKDIPLMSGTNADDMAYRLLSDSPPSLNSNGALVSALKSPGPFGLCSDSEVQKVVDAEDAIAAGASRRSQFVRIATAAMDDSQDAMAIRRSSAAHANTYIYKFGWQPTGTASWTGCCHTYEIPFVFQTLGAAPQLFDKGPTEQDISLSQEMAACWVAFARSGAPQVKSVPHWGPYSESARHVMYFCHASKIDVDPEAVQRQILASSRLARLAAEHRRKS